MNEVFISNVTAPAAKAAGKADIITGAFPNPRFTVEL